MDVEDLERIEALPEDFETTW